MADMTSKPYEMLKPSFGGSPPSAQPAAPEMGTIRRADAAFIELVRRCSLPVLRVSLGLVFVWFGLLKVFDVSPVADTVARTISILPARTAVLLTGVVEVIIGFGLLTRLALRLTLVLFFFQMFGTFISAARYPSSAFQDGNPLLLTDYGEFLVKNFILISAGCVILGTVRRRRTPKTFDVHQGPWGLSGRPAYLSTQTSWVSARTWLSRSAGMFCGPPALLKILDPTL